MRWIRPTIALGLVGTALTIACFAQSGVANPAANAALSADDQKTIDGFLHATKDYLSIQRSAPSDAKLKSTKDVADIEKRRKALQQVIVAARPNAKQGDLFTPPVADLFRRLMTTAMDSSDGNKVRSSLQHAEPGAATQASQIAVNRNYPNKHGQPLQSSPATLLQHLPILPKGIEYRMVGSTLVLRDTEANIVVDYLPNAPR